MGRKPKLRDLTAIERKAFFNRKRELQVEIDDLRHDLDDIERILEEGKINDEDIRNRDYILS
jgi:hypothetical protein